jgi:urate oxidase
MTATLRHNSYGKSAVRLTKVVRDGGGGTRHELFEIEANVQLEGDFDAAYRDGDNRNVVATDSIKNTVYVLAKENDFTSAEDFAVIVARHFVATYKQVTQATVELTQSIWRRIEVDGKPHDHAFTGGGPQRRYARAVANRNWPQPVLVGGVRELAVLKTTASEWRDFVDDRYRTLKDIRDRIMATKIDADWAYNSTSADFVSCAAAIERAILTTFATRHSLGVQQTLLAMGEAALAACDAIESISFELPNLHRIPFNLEPFGLKFENDVFVATDEPHGLIKGTVTRGK